MNGIPEHRDPSIALLKIEGLAKAIRHLLKIEGGGHKGGLREYLADLDAAANEARRQCERGKK